MKPAQNCPFAGFQPCKKFDCGFYFGLRGKNPNTGDDVDEYGCAVAWLPLLMIENAHQSRQCAGAVESFRNEMVEANERSVALALSNKLLGAAV